MGRIAPGPLPLPHRRTLLTGDTDRALQAGDQRISQSANTVAHGPGKLSLDYLLGRRLGWDRV
jgi:hypothetical protein